MDLGNRGGRARRLLVWSCATAAVAGAWGLTAPSVRAGTSALVHRRLDAVPLDRALADLAAAVVLCCAVWLWLGTSYVVLEAGRGRAPGRLTSVWVPSALRHLVLGACGTAMVGALAQPAVGATADVGHRDHRTHAVEHSPVAGLPLPERAAVRQPTGADVVVAPGDSLWSIAARSLPAQSPDAVITERWREIYAANRARIGPDPDLIVPGVRLHLPGRDLP